MNRSEKDILRILQRKLNGKCGPICPKGIAYHIWGASEIPGKPRCRVWDCEECQKYFGNKFKVHVDGISPCPCFHPNIDKTKLFNLLDLYCEDS